MKTFSGLLLYKYWCKSMLITTLRVCVCHRQACVRVCSYVLHEFVGVPTCVGWFHVLLMANLFLPLSLTDSPSGFRCYGNQSEVESHGKEWAYVSGKPIKPDWNQMYQHIFTSAGQPDQHEIYTSLFVSVCGLGHATFMLSSNKEYVRMCSMLGC